MKFSELQLDQIKTMSRTVSEEDVRRFTELSGDTNGVHQGKDGIIHGMLLASFISTFIGTVMPGEGSIWISADITFMEPVKIGESIRIIGTVRKKEIDPGTFDTNKVQLWIDINNSSGELVLFARCWIKMPD